MGPQRCLARSAPSTPPPRCFFSSSCGSPTGQHSALWYIGLQHNGPNHLGLWPQLWWRKVEHGLSPNTMALITSGCDAMRLHGLQMTLITSGCVAAATRWWSSSCWCSSCSTSSRWPPPARARRSRSPTPPPSTATSAASTSSAQCVKCITLEPGGVTVFNSIALIHPARTGGLHRRGRRPHHRPRVLGREEDLPTQARGRNQRDDAHPV